MRFLLLAIVLFPVTAWGLSDGIDRSSHSEVVDDASAYVSLLILDPHLNSANGWTDDAFSITHDHADDITMDSQISLKDSSTRFSIDNPQVSLDPDQTGTIRISDSSGDPGTFTLDVVFVIDFHAPEAVGTAGFERSVEVVVE